MIILKSSSPMKDYSLTDSLIARVAATAFKNRKSSEANVCPFRADIGKLLLLPYYNNLNKLFSSPESFFYLAWISFLTVDSLK